MGEGEQSEWERKLEALEAANLAAAAANNARLEELEKDAERMRAEIARYEREAADRSFSHWRQTSDGQAYMQWERRSKMLAEITQEIEKEWRAANENFANAHISAEEKKRVERGEWITPPLKYELVRGIIRGAVIYVPISLGVGFLLSPSGIDSASGDGLRGAIGSSILTSTVVAFWVVVLVPVLALLYQRTPRWSKPNEEAGLKAQLSRIERYGYDPLEPGSTPQTIVKQEILDDARRALKIIRNSHYHHPTPEELFRMPLPELISRDQVRAKAMLPAYDAIAEKVTYV